MAKKNQEREDKAATAKMDKVLLRMLKSPPKQHKKSKK